MSDEILEAPLSAEAIANEAKVREVALQLKVTHSTDYEGVLVVDAEAVMTNPHQVRTWLLDPYEDTGLWMHVPSDETPRPLFEILDSIAVVYALALKDWNLPPAQIDGQRGAE